MAMSVNFFSWHNAQPWMQFKLILDIMHFPHWEGWGLSLMHRAFPFSHCGVPDTPRPLTGPYQFSARKPTVQSTNTATDGGGKTIVQSIGFHLALLIHLLQTHTLFDGKHSIPAATIFKQCTMGLQPTFHVEGLQHEELMVARLVEKG
jgi:hypothetical protein